MAGEDEYGEEGYTVIGSEHYTAYKGHTTLSRALFFALGWAVGAGIALLLTPQPGSQTRRQLQEASRDTREKVTSCYGRVSGMMGATLSKGKELVREQKPLLAAAIEAGRAAYEKEKAEKMAHRA
jgi:gas vesicle protein